MIISKDFFQKQFDFDSYFQHILNLYEEGKTTGSNQSPEMIHYTQLSITRMKRWLKSLQPSKELLLAAQNSKRKNWLIITEAWCGDAANIIPLIVNLSKEINGVQLRFILRDEHPEIMNHFLTNKSRSIPVLLAMDDDMSYNTFWGPRPKPAQKMALKFKARKDLTYKEFSISLQKWYLEDRGQTLDNELIRYIIQ